MTERRLPSALVLSGIAALFFAATFAVYGGSLRNEFVTWDDMGLIRENPNVHEITPETIKNVFTSYDPELYIPLTFVSYQIDDLLGGGDPFLFHLTNTLLHALNALLVALLLYQLLGNGVIAVAAGLLFAFHPLNAETVAWMSARKDTLSTFFFLLSAVTYLRFTATGSRKSYGASIITFALGLLSKVMIVTLPILLILLDVAQGRKIDRRSLMEKVPYFVLSIMFGIVALFGKSEVLVSSTLWQKILMAGKSTVFYLEKFFVPSGLSVMYPYGKTIETSADFLIPAVVVIAFAGLIAWLWNKRRLTAIGLLWFLITLVPTFTNFAKGGEIYIASDRYAYVPMIGLLIALGALASQWMTRSTTVRQYTSKRNSLGVLLALILLVFAWRCATQAATWKNSETLYLNVLRFHPNAQAAHNNLGMEYLAHGLSDDALKEFDTALAIRPDPRTKANGAAALAQKGLLDQALAEYEAMVKIAPDLAEGHYGIGNIHQRRGNLREAAVYYRRALEVDPSYTNALNNLGAVYIQLEDWESAIMILEESIRRQPDFVESYYNLAGAYERAGRTAEAEETYRRALALHPSDPDALASLATLVYDRGEIDEAAELLMQALEIQDSNPIAIALVLRMKRDGVAE